MANKLNYWEILALVFLFSCETGLKEFIYETAYVKETQHIHVGKGFYKLRVTYVYIVNDSQYIGSFEHKYERRYTAKYSPGDSVRIKYDKEQPENSEFVELVYKKKGKKE